MNTTSVTAWVTSACLVLFAFSGLVKWLPVFPVDATILFGALLVLPAGLAVVNGVPKLRGLVDVSVLLTFCFFAWYAFTAVYSISSQFWMRKELTLILDLMAFLVPLMCFTQSRHFRAFNISVLCMAAAAILVVLGMYVAGLIPVLTGSRTGAMADRIPDYLSVGTLVGCGVLLALARPRLPGLAFAAAGIAAMLVLTARGPVLFAVLLIPLGMLLYRGRPGSMSGGGWRYLLVLVVSGVLFSQWKGAEAAFTRFAKIFSSTRDLDQTLRINEFSVAGDVIADRPLLGVGIGGYGPAGYGRDEDFYPHNLVLEAFAEAGLPGVLLFTLSIIVLVVVAANTRRHAAMAYFMVIIFLLLNYSKSGGFVGARDLYMFIGVFLAYVNAPSIDDEQFHNFALARAGPRIQ